MKKGDRVLHQSNGFSRGHGVVLAVRDKEALVQFDEDHDPLWCWKNKLEVQDETR